MTPASTIAFTPATDAHEAGSAPTPDASTTALASMIWRSFTEMTCPFVARIDAIARP